MLIAIPMRIIPFFIIERVKPIIKPEGYACPVVERYVSKRSLHPTQWKINFGSCLYIKIHNSPHILFVLLKVIIISHTILSPAFVMVRSRRKILGLSPSGKAQHFDCCIRGFESHQPRLLGCACTWQRFISHRPSDTHLAQRSCLKGLQTSRMGSPYR